MSFYGLRLDVSDSLSVHRLPFKLIVCVAIHIVARRTKGHFIFPRRCTPICWRSKSCRRTDPRILPLDHVTLLFHNYLIPIMFCLLQILYISE
ncbi:uncharacterized protein EI90DRAFT_3034610 [Cantharellus anzutake]|uniref:uncharacterized protein n=1 Tax=Cantharellus anzutake TaxID=1750568 RepID=UPI0019037E5E|nr:uncharacterized protein EI90DRAFT_3034610 [Cantharellus anzutake]KAF8341608.1 hypothetical protein EI90DRAFT_3034610 [Cantharellus anzutake]